MICGLAVHRTREGSYMLRVTGRAATGETTRGGLDAKHYVTVDALFADLDRFALDSTLTEAARRELANPEARNRFIPFAEDVQITAEILHGVDLNLVG